MKLEISKKTAESLKHEQTAADLTRELKESAEKLADAIKTKAAAESEVAELNGELEELRDRGNFD